MERREFLTVAGTVAVGTLMRNSEFGVRNGAYESISHSAFRIPHSQNPTLGPAVFAGREMKPPHRNGTVAVEPSTSYQSFLQLEDKLGGWKFSDGSVVTERLRIIKSPEEIALIRRAIAATEASIAATFSQLAAGMTE